MSPRPPWWWEAATFGLLALAAALAGLAGLGTFLAVRLAGDPSADHDRLMASSAAATDTTAVLFWCCAGLYLAWILATTVLSGRRDPSGPSAFGHWLAKANRVVIVVAALATIADVDVFLRNAAWLVAAAGVFAVGWLVAERTRSSKFVTVVTPT
jgi:hypothetical protein